jgi:hypothetical protein
MAQPRHFQQRPISKEEKLAWIYRSDLHKRTNPTDKSQQAYGMNRQTTTEMGADSASSCPIPCNITPPVVSSSQSDRNSHTRSLMKFGSSSQAQPTSYQQSPPLPLGVSPGPSETRDRSNCQKHAGELVLEGLDFPVAQPEVDPLGSEHVRIAARKEVRRRQVENKNTRLNQFREQAGPGKVLEIASQETEITRLEAMMDEQMKDVKGGVDKIESMAKSWLQGHVKGLSTCYYWEKHQKDSTQPPCQLGSACRFPHCYIGGASVASAQYKPDANPRRSLSPALMIRRHRQVTEGHHDRPNAPSFKPASRINHPISRSPINKTPMKYPPPPRPSGPFPLGSSQRSMAELRVPQVCLPLRPKVQSAPPAFQDTEVNIFEQNSLGNSRRETNDLRTLPKESYSKRDHPSDPSPSISSARRYRSSNFSQDSGSAQHTSECSNASMEMAFKNREWSRIITELALPGKAEYSQWLNDNQQGFMAPVKTSHQGTLQFGLEPYFHPLSTSSPEYQAKKLERELRESEERGEKEIIERARDESIGTVDRPEPEDHFKTASMNALNAAEEERKLAYGRERKSGLRDALKGPFYSKDMRDGVTFNGTLSSGNVLENYAITGEQPALKNKPLVIRPRPINPPKQGPKVEERKMQALDFHQPRSISGPLRRRPMPANVEPQALHHPHPINPPVSINLAPEAKQPKCQPLNIDVPQRPILGLEKKKWTTAELIHKHKLAMQNSEARREMLHSGGVTGALNGAVGENSQTALRQTEAKELAPKQTSLLETDKPAFTEEDDQFFDVELADEEKASSGVNGEEEADWVIVGNGL